MVETIWTKLHAPHAVIEPVSETSSQERNFLLQRRERKIRRFAS